jgi:hypothetical protein
VLKDDTSDKSYSLHVEERNLTEFPKESGSSIAWNVTIYAARRTKSFQPYMHACVRHQGMSAVDDLLASDICLAKYGAQYCHIAWRRPLF